MPSYGLSDNGTGPGFLLEAGGMAVPEDCPPEGCCGGGGGDGDCCVCGGPCTFLVETLGDDPPHVTGSTSVSDDGTIMRGCCTVAAPVTDNGQCGEIGIDLIGPNAQPFDFEAQRTGCGIYGQVGYYADHFVEGCDTSEFREGMLAGSAGVSAHAASIGACPQVRIPANPGAIVSGRMNSSGSNGASFYMWGGSSLVRGPLVGFTRQQNYTLVPGGDGVTTFIRVWTFVGLDGSASCIASMPIRCNFFACLDDDSYETGDDGSVYFSQRVPGGVGISGGLNCAGAANYAGNATATVPVNCGLDEDTCVLTADVVARFNFSGNANLSAIMASCEPSPRGSDSGIGEQDATGFFIPPVFLAEMPGLQEAYDALRLHFGNASGGPSRVPPPGGFALDPRAAAIIEQQLRGGGCSGCGQ